MLATLMRLGSLAGVLPLRMTAVLRALLTQAKPVRPARPARLLLEMPTILAKLTRLGSLAGVLTLRTTVLRATLTMLATLMRLGSLAGVLPLRMAAVLGALLTQAKPVRPARPARLLQEMPTILAKLTRLGSLR